jgi:dihydroorotase
MNPQPMQYALRNALIVDSLSPYNGQQVNIHLENGIIRRIVPAQTRLDTDAQVIEVEGLHISTGWLDMRASIPDPGLEHKETLESGTAAAITGGFTGVALLPNTQPVLQTKNGIAYHRNFAQSQAIDIYPIAAVTVRTEGKELTEMIDLHTAGAVAFSDGHESIQSADIVLKTLQYLQKFNGLLINQPEEKGITQFGVMNEGLHSNLLGLKGMPALAEEMMIQRDLSLLAYAGGRLHFSLISTANSVALIRAAKQRGLQVSCDIAAHQLAFDDAILHELESIYKVRPPFRTQADIAALWQGLADDTIDAVVSDHYPQDEESKNVEFDMAEFGIIGFETLFAVLNTLNNRQSNPISLAKLIEKITVNPRRILGLPLPMIAEGAIANLTLFSPNQTWTYISQAIRSKAHNTPFIGYEFTGRAIGIFNKKMYQSCE